MRKTVQCDNRGNKDTHTQPPHNTHKSTWCHGGVLSFCKLDTLARIPLGFSWWKKRHLMPFETTVQPIWRVYPGLFRCAWANIDVFK